MTFAALWAKEDINLKFVVVGLAADFIRQLQVHSLPIEGDTSTLHHSSIYAFAYSITHSHLHQIIALMFRMDCFHIQLQQLFSGMRLRKTVQVRSSMEFTRAKN